MRHEGLRCYALVEGEQHLERCDGSAVEIIFDQAYCGYHAEGLRAATGGRFVYFAERHGRIKIGLATDPAARMRELGARLLATVPGGRALERELHERFIDHCIIGEWFEDCQPIRDYIASRGRNPEAAPATEGKAI